MSSSLKNKAVKGVAWSFVDNIANSGITFLVGLVLARLLSPAEYGIMAMIAIFIAVSNSIIDSGFSNALIRKIEIKQIDYNTVFFFNLFVSFILYILLYAISPAISNFFKEPVLVEVTRVIGWVLIINALAIIPRTIFIRNVEFKVQTKVSLISSIFSGIVGIGMAFYGMGVWSLVGQQLSRQLLNTLFLWIFCHWRPAWEFSRKSFKEMFGFGSKLLLSGLLNTIYKDIYYIIIGRFYSSAQLGQYTRAQQFNIIFSSNLTSVVQRVSYPVLSSMQDESERLKQAYRKVIKVTMLVTFACMLGLAAVAKPLIVILIGEKWLMAVSFLQIICFAGMLYPLHAINLNILQVKGRSDLFLKLEILKKIIAVGPIIIGIFYGIEYMLWGSVFTSFIAYFLNSFYSADLINYPTKDQIEDILPTFGVSFVTAAAMWCLSLLDISMYILLPMQCLLGLVLSVVIYEKLKLEEYIEVRQMLISLLKRVKKYIRMENKVITVTAPLLPSLDDFLPYLQDIWQRKWLTNNGYYHQELEKALCEYLKVPYISLFTNGTLPLICALQALRITGEVITTPYSFVATTHALWWNGIKPVFVDIDPITCNIDPDKIEAAITPKTTAIMPVHVYGRPCETERIQAIADKYGLKVIYDAAHAFGVEVNGNSILSAGDMSTLSFHATKVYNTIEGGALVCHDENTKKRIDYLKNFGFAGETTIVAPGINGKMDEIRSAYGLLNLQQVDAAIAARREIALKYREGLKNIGGIRFMDDMLGVRHNYSYFPVFVDAEDYGMTRDELYFKMKEQNILGRRYFYPLISEFSTYRGLESASPYNLPIATQMADSVICLPMYCGLTPQDTDKILNCIFQQG